MNQVLIVAKDANLREELRRLAQSAGVSADVLEDFEPALAQIQREPPVLVLAEDPPADEIMARLQNTLVKHAPVTPLILYLPERDGQRALKRMAQGAYDCLCPPLAAGDFLAAGKRAVSRLGRRLLTSRPVKRVAWWRQPTTYMLAGFATFIGLLFLGLYGLWAPPFQIYKLANDHPVAVAGSGDGIWVADWSQQNVTEMHVKGDYMSITEVHKLADYQPVNVVVTPYYVYTASVDGRLRRHRRDEGLTVTASAQGPGFAPGGLAWDGESLWSCDSETGKIYEYDARLAVKATLDSPVPKPAGLAWEGSRLWVADGEKNTLWVMSRQGTGWQKKGPYLLEVFAHNHHLKISGFTIWAGRIWFVSESDGVLVSHKMPQG